MLLPLAPTQPARLIKTTTSRCPACLKPVAAEVWERHGAAGGVWMVKACGEHGRSEVLLARDPRYYHESHGAGGGAEDGGCCGGGGCCGPAAEARPGADPFETLSTCIALIEIVDSCNLECPTCYASSPRDLKHVDCTPAAEVIARVGGVLARKGFLDILQLSGGEPTIHPEFFEILEWAIGQPKIGYILLNTNAVRLAGDRAFRERLGELRRAKGKFELYVQFDGVQEAGQVELRGADLRDVRRRAIDEAGRLGVPSTLAMVVTPATRPHLGEALRFGLGRKHVRGITLQPMFRTGRLPVAEGGAGGGVGGLPRYEAPPISVGDVVVACVEQSQGLLREEDFTPLPCGDPNCHTISYLLRTPAGVQPLSRLVDVKAMQGFLANRTDYRLEDLARCGCDHEPLGEVIKGLELRPESPFRIFIKPFMDASTFDQHRIDRCCTHVVRPDGSLDSFCRYYLEGGAAGWRARNAAGVRA